MALRPTDMLEIQTAIDEYERKFPRRAAPTAEVALAWRLGKREWARRQAAQRAEQAPELAPASEEKSASVFAEQECNRFAWAWEQVRLQLSRWHLAEDVSESSDESLRWARKLLQVGWWGVVAVVVVSVFFLGAIVGGFK